LILSTARHPATLPLLWGYVSHGFTPLGMSVNESLRMRFGTSIVGKNI